LSLLLAMVVILPINRWQHQSKYEMYSGFYDESDCSDTVSQNEVDLGFRMHTLIQVKLKLVHFSLGKCILCLSEPVKDVKN